MQLEPGMLRTIVNDRPMVRLLMVVDKVDGYPTRKLLKKLGSNDLHRLLARAESEGYIRREKQKPEGRGNHLICNRLTEKGRVIVGAVRQA